ncbi:MAG: TonB-dependent receptor plug domain-containing protein, partial [Paramuribaculum sp.]|nr:TonB-dependent receptor plug domain-containing protein [Paramuribaculum sp.]
MNKSHITFLAVLMLSVTNAAASETGDSVISLEKAIGEVTVTAIKQNADLTLHPVAGTVINRAQVERLNIVSVRGASEIAPNVYMPQYGSRMTSSIYVRGIGARIDQPVVGLNIDNVPFLNKDNYDFDIPDIARMEIIRGPQSTLYGRNTMGGLINIYTISPLSYQGSRFFAEAGKGNLYRAALSHYMKMRPDLGMSFTGDFHYFGGLRKNLFNGSRADRDKGGSLRWKTDWKPSDRLSFENAAWFTLSRSSGYPYAYEETGEINYNDTCFYRRNSFADGLTVKYSGGKWSLSSITSMQYINDNMTLDQDFLPLDYFTLTQKRHEWALTQDFIARGSVGDKYRWLGGAFGFYKRTSMDAPVTFKDYGISQLIEGKRNEVNPDYPIKWDSDRLVVGSNFSMRTLGVALYP